MTDCGSPSKFRLPSEGLLQLSPTQPSSAAAAAAHNINNNCHKKISKNHSQTINNTSSSSNNDTGDSNSDGHGNCCSSILTSDAVDAARGVCASNVVVVTADPNHAVCVVANNSKHLNVKSDGGAGSSGGMGYSKEMQQQRRWSEHRQLMVVIYVCI